VTGWKKKIALLSIVTALALSTALLLASPEHARAASLASRLNHARHQLRHARAHVRAARRAYRHALAVNKAAAIAAAASIPASEDPADTPTPDPTGTAVPTADPSAVPTSDGATPTPAPSVAAAPSPAPGSAVVTVPAARLRQLRAAIRHHRHRVVVLARRVNRLRRELRLQRAAARGDWMPIVRDAARKNGISASGLRRLMSLESGGRAASDNGPFHGLFQYCWSTWRAAWNPFRARSIYDGEAQIRATAVAIRKGFGPSQWPNTYPLAF